MATYQEYQKQIAQLQELAGKARAEEIAQARKRIKALMDENGLTAADLEEPTSKKSTKTKNAVAAKYKDPVSGHTWTGRGRAPRWLDGKNREDFRIS